MGDVVRIECICGWFKGIKIQLGMRFLGVGHMITDGNGFSIELHATLWCPQCGKPVQHKSLLTSDYIEEAFRKKDAGRGG